MKNLTIGGVVLAVVVVMVALMGTEFTKIKLGYEGGKIPVVGSGKNGSAEDVQIMSKGWNAWASWKYDAVVNPLYMKEYVYTAGPAKGSKGNEAISFQDVEKMKYTADVGIKLRMLPGKTGYLYQDFHKSVNQLIDTNLYNSIRKHMGDASSTLNSDGIIGEGREKFATDVTNLVQDEWKDYFIVEDIFFIGPIEPPKAVRKAMENAVKKQEEVSVAESDRLIKEKETNAVTFDKRERADAIAYEITEIAKAEAGAIKKIKKQLGDEGYNEYLRTRKWNGSKATTILAPNTGVMIK